MKEEQKNNLKLEKSNNGEVKFFGYQTLFDFSKLVFLKIGCSEFDATTATQVLLSADLRGVDSHGIARLSGYVRLWEVNRVNAKANPSIIHETPSTATIDADAALGLIAAPFAMNVAVEKAKQVGTGWVSVQNSNHFGIAGIHAMMALPNDMIGIAMTNASPLVAPTFSKERLLGTNPIAVAIPSRNRAPFVADFATTTAANGKLEILQRLQEPVPSGWVQDADGNNTTNASAVKEGGALLPLGGTRLHGSHKGFMLGSIVDIFSGVLSGANFGPWVPPFPAYVPMPEDMPGKGLGHFFGAMRIDAFRPKEDFYDNMEKWIDRFKASKTVDVNTEMVIPGEPEANMEKERLANGIPLLQSVLDDVNKMAIKTIISLYEIKLQKNGNKLCLPL